MHLGQIPWLTPELSRAPRRDAIPAGIAIAAPHQPQTRLWARPRPSRRWPGSRISRIARATWLARLESSVAARRGRNPSILRDHLRRASRGGL
jgi:hypothetical protein